MDHPAGIRQRIEEDEEKKGEENNNAILSHYTTQYPSQQLIHVSSTTNSNTSREFQVLSNTGSYLFSFIILYIISLYHFIIHL